MMTNKQASNAFPMLSNGAFIRRLCLCLLLMISTSTSIGLTQASASLIGSGEMRVYFMHIYTVSYYASDSHNALAYPVALEIEYQKKLSANTLVKATQKEWRRMNLKHERQDAWLNELNTIWPDVRPGDTLRIQTDKNGVSTFSYNENVIGYITDAPFAHYFLSIWLSDQSRDQNLRHLLLGKR